MRKFFVIFSCLMWIFLISGVCWSYYKQKSIKSFMSTIIGEKYFLKDSFSSLLMTDTVMVDDIWLNHGGKKIKFSEIVSLPCLIVYLPSIQEDICNSCIEYALNGAMTNIGGFSENKHVCIISLDSNPEIKERIYKKECYVVDKALLDVPQINMPYYFILDKDKHVKYLFAPNSLFKEYTTVYWKRLKSEYKVFEGN